MMNLENDEFFSKLMARRRFGMRPGLDAMRGVLAELGDPQDSLRCVHVAGTNGKGAVSALVDAALRAAGFRTCRYTSPHLVTVNERFFMGGAPVADEMLSAVAADAIPAIERFERRSGMEVTFFEALTALAFAIFSRVKPDVVVLETGLGGRLDATNVISDSLVSVITRIGLDHCEWLGTSHAAIAEEKAGIIKPGRPVVCGAMPESARETVARFASLNGCTFWSAEEHVSVASATPFVATTSMRNLPPVRLALSGAFQVENAVTALTALDALVKHSGFDIPDHAVKTGFETVVWPGRCQRIERDGVTFYVDGAHNPDGATAFRDALRTMKVPEPIGLVAGFCGDKDVLAHLRTMSAISTHGWTVPIRNARSLDPVSAAERMLMAGFTSAEPCPSLADALTRAASWARSNGGTVAVCGSLFLVGEALVSLDAFPWPVRAPDANELTLRD